MFKWLANLLGMGGGAVPNLSPAEAQEKIKQGAVMIDVRSPMERKQAMIKGTLAMPLGEIESKHDKLKGKTVICQCASGARSQMAARNLKAKGYDVYNLSGGISAWQAAGLPVVKG